MATTKDFVLKVYLTEEDAIKGDKTTPVTTAATSGELITTASEHDLEVGDWIFFTGTVGNASVTDLYHVITVPSATTFTFSTTKGGSAFNISSSTVTLGFVTRSNSLLADGAGYNLNSVNTTIGVSSNAEHKAELGHGGRRGTVISTSGFWTHVNYFYRLESNEPVKKFYIDWDDGEDNDPTSRANYSLKEFDIPQEYAVFEHVYTKHGAFFPKIKVTSPEGYESKYYTASWGATAAAPLASAQVVTIACAADSSDSLNDTWFRIYDGNNQGYHCWVNVDDTSSYKHTTTIPEGFIEVQIDGVETDDTAAEVAAEIQSDLNDLTAFTATVSDNDITLTNNKAGFANYPETANSTHTFAVTTYGAENVVSSIENDPQTAVTGTSRILQVDSVSSPRIPVLCPSNAPPVAVLKLDKTNVLAGIDNEPLGGIDSANVMVYLDGKDFYDANAATINGKLRRAAEVTLANIIDVVWQDQNNIIYKETKGANTQASTTADYVIGTGPINVKKILSVKIRDLREGGPDSTSNLYPNEKIHLVAYENGEDIDLPVGSSVKGGTSPTLCSVSLGNPLATEADPSSIVTVDGSESYSPNSNVSIDKYVFDTGKHTEGASSVIAAISEVKLPSATMFKGLISPYMDESELPNKNISYTFDIGKGEQLDSNHRFYDKEQLIRIQVQDSSRNTKMDDDDLIEYSLLEVDSTRFGSAQSVYYPKFAKPQGVLLVYSTGTGSATWTGLEDRNIQNNNVLIGGDADTAYSLKSTGTAAASIPENFMLFVKDKKFNKIHFNLDNEIIPDVVRRAVATMAVALRVWYSTSGGWKPVDFVDTTEVEKGGAVPFSMTTSGSITFDMPTDWESLSSEDVAAAGTAAPVSHDITGANDPTDHWNFNGHGVLVGFAVTAATNEAVQVVRAHVTNNLHSQVVTVRDPMHVSLSEIPISQSVTYKRGGQYHRIEDRLGRAEIRKIGASGGNITFGGVDLTDGYREKLEGYHRDSVPVFLDIQHKGGDYTRFYGVIQQMSQDQPVGNQYAKFGIELGVSYIIEFTSSGAWTKKISLGGDIADEPKYVF